SFALARQHVILESPPSGDPVEDGHRILAALARGRSYCAFDGLADARGARFRVISGGATGTLGDTVTWHPGARLEVVLPTSDAGRATVEVVRVAEDPHGIPGSRSELDPGRGMSIPGPGIYRFEVMLERGRRVPWILTNPIRVATEGAEDGSGGEAMR
ncbi:MAG TPA: hypothetical protein VE173_05950, partial [Longimicrobiales bacterium]|nr:hypothetical protein [Longimicrobiales bacterium]